jgi:hypothetical protein
LKQIKLTGAVPKYVPLGGKAATLADPWALDIDALEKFTYFIDTFIPPNLMFNW